MSKKPLSQAQIEQRRQAGLSLAAKVDRSYYRFIGSLGGRRFCFNQLMSLATTYQFPRMEGATVSQERLDLLTLDMRDHYRQEAHDKYGSAWGNRIMLALYAPESEAENVPNPA